MTNTNTAERIEDDIQHQIDDCQARIGVLYEEVSSLENELQSISGELESVSPDNAIYEALSGICDNLDRLDELGGRELFWSGLLKADQAEEHVANLKEQAAFYERRVAKVKEQQEELLSAIRTKNDTILFLENELDALRERAEEAENEFVVARQVDITSIPYRVMVMPWTKKTEDDRKFRKILLIALLIGTILGILIPMYDVPLPDRSKPVEIPERLTKFIKKEKPKPPPKPKQEQKKPEEKKKEVKKEPTKEERKQAKEKVKSKGVLAFKNNFADLLDDASLDKLGANANLSDAGSTARKTTRSILTSQATSSSSGINSSGLSRNVAGTGDKIAAVAFSRVESEIGTAVAEDRPLSDGKGPSRTDEEIQIVFDKYKAALYRIYNRELRSNPTLQGKVVLRITIQPDGTVSKASVKSTDMDAPKLLDKIVARVKRFNFGPKEGVPAVTILYPIDFLPAN